MIRFLEISAIFGAKVAVIHPLHHMQYEGHEEEIIERNMRFYKGLIPYAKEYGIKIGVENMTRIDERRGCRAQDVCGTPKEFIRALGHDRLKLLHVHDNDYTYDQHLLPYLGKIDWGEVTKALGDIDYDGDLTLEIYAPDTPDELLQPTYDYFDNVGKYPLNEIERYKKIGGDRIGGKKNFKEVDSILFL